jgi:hypothetical protein
MKVLLRLFKKRIVKLLLSALDNDTLKKRIVDAINKKVNIPNMSEKQEEKLINTLYEILVATITETINKAIK